MTKPKTFILKKKDNLDDEKIKCALGNREFWFLAGQDSRDCCVFTSDFGIRGINLSLTHISAKFKQLY